MTALKSLRVLRSKRHLLQSSQLLAGNKAVSKTTISTTRRIHQLLFSNSHTSRIIQRSAFASLSRLSMDDRYLLQYQNPFLDAILCPKDEENNIVRILACSPASLSETEKGMLSRFIQWCREWIEAVWEALQVSVRVSEIGLRLSPLLILSPAAYLASKLQQQQQSHRGGTSSNNNIISDVAWNYFIHAVQGLGPGYVKLCQWISTRRDIFPVFVCDRLSQLHDRGYPHSWRESDTILKEAFGDDYKEKGLTLEEVIGCGSAAQVYRGSLKTTNESNGEETVKAVAVKILHPGFQRQIENDLWLMDTVARWVDSIPSETIKMVSLPRAVQNFGGNLRLQSDLTLEGDNLKQFRSNFYGKENDASSSSILFPQPIDGWVSPKVLVEDLAENSTPIADFLRDNTELGLQTRKELAGPLLRAFLKMVFQDNFVHADIHPGNVLIQTTTTAKDSSKESVFTRFFQSNDENSKGETVKRNVVFLDAGIVTSLNENDRKNLKDLFRAVIVNDGYEAGRLMVERARFERCSQKPGGVEAFASGVGDIVAEFHDNRKSGLTLGAVRIGALLSRVLDLCREHGVEIDPAMASIVISTLVLEGLGRSLEPSLNLMDCAVPFVLGRGKV